MGNTKCCRLAVSGQKNLAVKLSEPIADLDKVCADNEAALTELTAQITQLKPWRQVRS